MRILPYFIYKEIDGGISDLATELEGLNDAEEANSANFETGTLV